MASITIRNLDDGVKKQLRKKAAENGRSLEAEVRDILARSTKSVPSQPRSGLDLVRPLLEFGEKFGDAHLNIPERGPMREIPAFSEGARPFRRRK
ncbi:MAG TPA: hypothetical protein VGG10_11315 [Rhizomicrobium sp.]|jgi:plasmid stability protein